MDWIIPKKRGLYASILCVIVAIISCFFNLGPIWCLSLLMQAVIFLFIHVLMQNVEIRVADIAFGILTAISLCGIMWFWNTPLAFKISVHYLDNKIDKYAIQNCKEFCTINGNKIYNNKKEIVYGWHGLEHVYDGYIEVKDNKIKYLISFEDKCVTKEFNTKYVISDGNCEI